ncbi:MAG: NAD(P)H-dependent oxidoreductase [Flavobacteriaceae bacterium]|nr:NAD(P)H-dependent oxidoreductase [Flavobacteriaceae bacterium]
MKIVAFGASSSKHSINKRFAHYTAQLLDPKAELLDLADFPLPVFSVDLEKEEGIPVQAMNFITKIKSANLLVISLAEHNGSYTAAFKNLFDWTSRAEPKLFAGMKMLLLSTAPGPRGGLGVMEAALVRFPIHGANIVAHFSLPKFAENFDETERNYKPSN